MGNIKRKSLICSLCLLSFLSFVKGRETVQTASLRNFSDSVLTTIKKSSMNDDSTFDEALALANEKTKSFDWITGFNNKFSYLDPSTTEGKAALAHEHFNSYEEDIKNLYEELDTQGKEGLVRLKDEGDNDVDNWVDLMRYKFDFTKFSFSPSPNNILVDRVAFNVAKGKNKYDMALPQIGKGNFTQPGITNPGQEPIFGGKNPVTSFSMSSAGSVHETLNNMLLTAGLSTVAAAVIVGGVKTIEGTIVAWFIPPFAKVAIIALALVAIIAVIAVYFQQIVSIFSAIAKALTDLVKDFVSRIADLFEDAKKKGYETMVDGSFWDKRSKSWVKVINLTATKAKELQQDKGNLDYFYAFRPNAILPKKDFSSNVTGDLRINDALWIPPIPITDDEAVDRLKNKIDNSYWRDAYTPLKEHAYAIEARVISELHFDNKSLLYVYDCPGDSYDEATERYHHIHVNHVFIEPKNHFIESHNFYGLPFSTNANSSGGSKPNPDKIQPDLNPF